MAAVYDQIGRGYVVTRQPDPRLARAIRVALGEARSVVNVGAGTGSYEPADLRVTAVEPSLAMIHQRPAAAAPVVQAVAERLPFPDAAFDAALAVLTVHHWQARAAAGLDELARVARQRVVILTWDPACRDAFWLMTQYVPEIVALDLPRFPSVADFVRSLGPVEVRPLPIPHDCQDGFLGAFWRRPEAYLDPNVRRAISGFAQLAPEVVEAGMARLLDDLRTGRWDAQFGWLRRQESTALNSHPPWSDVWTGGTAAEALLPAPLASGGRVPRRASGWQPAQPSDRSAPAEDTPLASGRLISTASSASLDNRSCCLCLYSSFFLPASHPFPPRRPFCHPAPPPPRSRPRHYLWHRSFRRHLRGSRPDSA
jgi:SAM-dependent methyltransferase